MTITIDQLQTLVAQLNQQQDEPKEEITSVDYHVGKKVIIRTYSAGTWFGKIEVKEKDEVILTEARRMYRWWAKKSISLSGVALYGIKHDSSKICAPVPSQWLQAIEIIEMTPEAIESLETAPEVEAE